MRWVPGAELPGPTRFRCFRGLASEFSRFRCDDREARFFSVEGSFFLIRLEVRLARFAGLLAERDNERVAVVVGLQRFIATRYQFGTTGEFFTDAELFAPKFGRSQMTFSSGRSGATSQREKSSGAATRTFASVEPSST